MDKSARERTVMGFEEMLDGLMVLAKKNLEEYGFVLPVAVLINDSDVKYVGFNIDEDPELRKATNLKLLEVALEMKALEMVIIAEANILTVDDDDPPELMNLPIADHPCKEEAIIINARNIPSGIAMLKMLRFMKQDDGSIIYGELKTSMRQNLNKNIKDFF